MKAYLCTAIGMIGSVMLAALGGWDASIGILLFFMAGDYISGLIVAGVFHRSPKSKDGSLESRAGWKGLVRKGMALFLVLVGAQLDALLGLVYIRDAIIIAFIINELLSIIENAKLMDLTIPKGLEDATELLKDKNENKE